MKFPLKNIQFIAALLALAAVYVGCTKGPEIKSYNYAAPEPKTIFPDTGYAGFATVTITGTQFGDYKQAVKVFFGGAQSDSILSCEDGKIVARVPKAAVSGKVSLQVWTHMVDSIGEFRVVDDPVVLKADKDIGFPGDKVEISGKGFGVDLSKVKVTFNGTAAEINEVNDTAVHVTLPVGFSSGNIVVTVNGFPVTGPGFRAFATVPDPVYWLAFENDLNDQMSKNVATYTKGTGADLTYETGKSGLAARFPGYTPISPTTWGPTGSVTVTPPSIMQPKEFTVTCWVKWDAGRQNYPDAIFEFGEARGTRFCLLARMGSGTNNWNGTQQKIVTRYMLEKKVKDATGADINYEDYVGGSKYTPPADWAHVALVFSFSNKVMKIYMDGLEIGSKTLSRNDVDPSTLMNIKTVRVGGYAYGSGSETNFAGVIDEFKIFNTALNADQVYAIYYKNK